MKLKDNLRLRKIGNQYIIVDADTGHVNLTHVYTLNETAARLYEWLAEAEREPEALAGLLCREYDVEPDRALADVKRQLAEWDENGWIVK